jgi:two-component system, cell cycle sensor histidine kinase and response regulator CckA
MIVARHAIQPASPAEEPLTHAEALIRLADMEAALRAIAAGEVDAFVVSDGGGGGHVFGLTNADRPYRMFVENMRDGAATLSSEGLILYANRRLAELLSYPREWIAGAPLAGFVVGSLPAELATIGRPGLHETVELELLDANGDVVPVLVGASPLDVDGDALVCLTFTDLTSQKTQEREIVRLGRVDAERSQEFARTMAETQKLEALGVLAGGIAHDFNNLLTVIRGNTTVALESLARDAPARAPLEQVELAALRSTDLARQMLAYSGKGRFVVEIMDLAGTVRGLHELIKAAISKKAELSFDFAPDVPPIEADATQLRQVVLNLITNASDAIGDVSGTVHVRVGSIEIDRAHLSAYEFTEGLPEARYVFLEVADTGSGMDSVTRDKIFDPFFTTKPTGRGLGLAAVHGIVRAHHGAMKVESAPGQGTTFTLIFPASAKSLPAVPRVIAPRVGRAHGTVLVVDDDDAVRLMAVRMLESLGFTVESAVDGAEGLRVLTERANDFAFVLLDLMMPGMSGEEVVLELGRMGATVPVVLSSGYDAHETSGRFAGRGVAAVLQKPYGMEELRVAAFEVMSQSPR